MTIETIAATDIEAERARNSLLLDVRSPAEVRGGHVRGAINLPRELVTVAKVSALRGVDANIELAGLKALVSAANRLER